MPTVSVVVPNYNHARFLPQRIESVLRQTYQDFEVIVIDDCSTDDTRSVLSQYASDPRVRIEFNEVNSGNPFKQWNKGVGLARGKYVWIAEADDYADERLLERLVRLLDLDSEIAFAYCRSWEVTEEGQKIRFADFYLHELDLHHWASDFCVDGREECKNYFVFANPVPNASAVVFRKGAFERIGGADDSYRLCGDWKVWAGLALTGKISYVGEPMNYFRDQPSSQRRTAARVAVDKAEYIRAAAWVLNQLTPTDLNLEKLRRYHAKTWTPLVISLSVPLRLKRAVWRDIKEIEPHPFRRVWQKRNIEQGVKSVAVSDRTRNRNGRGILFVIPSVEPNGASISLLHFLRWFEKNGTRPFSILLASGGEMAGEYEKLASTWEADRSRWCPGGVRSQLFKAVGLGKWASEAEKRDLRRFAKACDPGLIYVNSVMTRGARLPKVLGLAIPVLTHVHELEILMRKQAKEELPEVLAATSRFIACSNAVRDNLLCRHKIQPDRVDVVHESIPVNDIRVQRSRDEVFRELQIPDGARLVMGCGTLDWRKGADLFLQLARKVTRQRSDVYFAWVGGLPRQILKYEHDVRLGGLTEKLRLTGLVSNATDYLGAADIFVLPSRDDPFPLVCLESAALGKPIVCFADGGGMPEFVEDDCGFIVPYLDIEAMTDRVTHLLDAPEIRLRMGTAARHKVTRRHDISVAGQKIAEVIERAVLRPESCAPNLQTVAEGHAP